MSKTTIVSALGLSDGRHTLPVLDWHALVALVLALATWFAGQPDVRFTIVGEPLVVSREHWQERGGVTIEHTDDDTVIVRTGENDRARARAEIDIAPSASEQFWRIGFDVTRLSEKDAFQLKANARVVVGWLENGERVGWAPTQLLSPFGDVTRIDTVIHVPPGADGLRIGFPSPREGSAWQLSAPRLSRVHPAPFASTTPVVLAVLWSALLLSLLSRALRRASSWHSGAVLLGLGIVVMGAGASREMMAHLVKPLIFLGSSVFSISAGWASLLVQKGGHFAAFMVLTLALSSARTVLALSTMSIITFCLAIAIVTESLQLFVVGRSPRLTDLVIDLAGIAAGFACIAIWRAWSARRARSET